MEPLKQVMEVLNARRQTCQLHRLGENHLADLAAGIVMHLAQPLADAQETIAALTKELEQEKQNAFGLAAAQCDDPIPGEYGHKLCGTAMEKDRQIAALQARVQVLEAEVDTLTQQEESWESQLTQRTAELEAAKAIQAIDLKNNNEYREQVANLQAELDRVRGELAHAKKMEAVQKEVADNQTWHVQKLRTLILALPKVEGEIEVKAKRREGAEWWSVAVDGWLCEYSPQFDDKEQAEAYASLLQHRQGMEG